jgi:cytochrome c-type biogenesis protein CcmH
VHDQLARWWPAVAALVLAGIIIIGLASATIPSDRGERLAAQLRCPVCQSESVADSTATTAREMRSQIDGFVGDGRSDEWILTYYEERYGRWVRLSPPLTGDTLLLWSSPALALLIGVFVVRSRRTPAPTMSSLAVADRQRLQIEIDHLRQLDERW